MADFSDKDDQLLFQHAKMFWDASKKVDWDYMCKKVKIPKKTRKQLQNRLKALKRRWGFNLNAFPERFYCVATPSKGTGPFWSVEPLPSVAAEMAVTKIFADIPKKVVHQSAKCVHENVGEILPSSVTELFSGLTINSHDVFIDIGAGIGNVVAQIALYSKVSLCIGVEMRADVVESGKKQVSRHVMLFPALRRVQYIASQFEYVPEQRFRRATILYCFNLLFQTTSQLQLEVLVCDLRQLKCVILAVLPCPRHRITCKREFCLLWTLAYECRVQVSWSSAGATMYVFKRVSD